MSDVTVERTAAPFRPRALAEVLLKVWAFTMLLRALVNIPMFIMQSWTMRGEGEDARVATLVTASGFIQLSLAVIASVAVMKLAPAIASRFVGETSADEAQLIAPPSWQALAFGLLGTYFLVDGLRSTAQVIFQLMTKPGYETESISYLWRNAPEQLAGALVMTIAGLILFAGRNGIAALWSRARRV